MATSSSDHSSSSSTGTFARWSSLCLDPPPPTTEGKKKTNDGGGGDDLRSVASDHFASLITGGAGSNSSGGEGGGNRSAELSRLVAALGPALGADQSRVRPRVRALRCLAGAVDGCSRTGDSGDGDADAASAAAASAAAGAGAGLTHQVTELVGTFLVGHCRPIQPNYEQIDGDDVNDEEEDAEFGEAVRDAAASAMVALLKCPLDLTSRRRELSEEMDLGMGDVDASAVASSISRAVGMSISLRLSLARKAVEARCQSADATDFEHQYTYDHGYGDVAAASGALGRGAGTGVIDDLSTLPRAKRSLCFDILDGAVGGVELDLRQVLPTSGGSGGIGASTKRDAADFAAFAATCLHGETDPRCLLQLLRLLRRVQSTFLPLFDALVSSPQTAADDNEDDDAVAMDTDDSALGGGVHGSGVGTADAPKFPTVDVFDAVAPYYPIKFTPPPNDPHGITREGLHDALMAILRQVDDGRKVGAVAGEGAAQGEGEDGGGGDTMTELASRLFLERLVPPPPSDPYGDMDDEDNIPSVRDKVEALADLSGLLVPPTTIAVGGAEKDPLCSVDVTLMRELSSALVKTHRDTVSEVATASNDEERDGQKELIDACRTLASTVAFRLETPRGGTHTTQLQQRQRLWEAFVVDAVRDLSPVLATSPQGAGGRSATAYLSSLAGCGGIRTLRTCLGGCLPPLLATLRDGSLSADEEKAAAAALGVGAFFSSSARTVEEAGRGGVVVVHPHPLRDYGAEAVRALCSFTGYAKVTSAVPEGKSGGRGGEDSSSPTATTTAGTSRMGNALKVAAVNALGSVLLATPSSVLTDAEIDMVRKELESLTDAILCGRDCNEERAVTDSEDNEWRDACSLVIGSALGRALTTSSDEGTDVMRTDGGVGDAPANKTCVVDDNEGLVSFINGIVFPRLLDSATTTNPSDDDEKKVKGKRSDWIALAHACRLGQQNASYRVVSKLVASIVHELREAPTSSSIENGPGHCLHPAMFPAKALSYVLREGGEHPTVAFHDLSPPNDTPFDIIDKFCPSSPKRESVPGTKSVEAPRQAVGMSTLMLPSEKAQSRAEAKRSTQLAYLILPQILPAYRASVPSSQRDRFIKLVSQGLPPLSEWDNARLCVTMPILSAILGGEKKAGTLDDAIIDSLEGMALSLGEYALCPDWDPQARSAAASCLFFIILYYQRDNTECLACSSLKNIISPAVINASRQLMESQEEDGGTRSTPTTFAFENALSLLALVGSAAACRGGSSSQTADQVTRFLVKLSCTGSAPAPLTNETVDFCSDGSSDFRCQECNLQIMTASAFGSMLSVQNGGPFWRQRMIHIAAPDILAVCKSSATPSTPPLGALAAACHITCCASNLAIGEQRVKELADIVARGLVECVNMKDKDRKELVERNSLMCIVLASLIKLISVAPDAMTPYVAGLIPNLLVLCSTTSANEDIPYQLLSLQCLTAVMHLPSARRACKAHKLTVVSSLAGMVDHPSVTIRQAAIKVRNMWYILD